MSELDALRRAELDRVKKRRDKLARHQRTVVSLCGLVILIAVVLQVFTNMEAQGFLNALALGCAAVAFLWSVELGRLRLDVARRQRAYGE